jgi:hypothetical protein
MPDLRGIKKQNLKNCKWGMATIHSFLATRVFRLIAKSVLNSGAVKSTEDRQFIDSTVAGKI